MGWNESAVTGELDEPVDIRGNCLGPSPRHHLMALRDWDIRAQAVDVTAQVSNSEIAQDEAAVAGKAPTHLPVSDKLVQAGLADSIIIRVEAPAAVAAVL